MNFNTAYPEVSKYLVVALQTTHGAVPKSSLQNIWDDVFYYTSQVFPFSNYTFPNPLMKTSVEAFVFLTSYVKIGNEILVYALNSKQSKVSLAELCAGIDIASGNTRTEAFHLVLPLFGKWKQRSSAYCRLDGYGSCWKPQTDTKIFNHVLLYLFNWEFFNVLYGSAFFLDDTKHKLFNSF
jgi:hypothetical protein